MWDIYDSLIVSVDDSIRLKDFAVGTYWTAVLTEDGSLGLAPSVYERYQRFPFSTDPKPGMLLSEAAAGLKSWNYAEDFPGAGRCQRISQPAGTHPR